MVAAAMSDSSSMSNGADVTESDPESEGMTSDGVSKLENTVDMNPICLRRQIYENFKLNEHEERDLEIQNETRDIKLQGKLHEREISPVMENGKDQSLIHSSTEPAVDMLDLRTPNNNRLQQQDMQPTSKVTGISNESLSEFGHNDCDRDFMSPHVIKNKRSSIISHHDIKLDRCLPYESLGPPIYDRYPPHPPSSRSPTTSDPPSDGGHHWTFEEQFKQLYELSEDPKRKEFLDDLFSFMQKRGTPVNRIPIMAKQVLDLYELFRLVVLKGGLVEVINRKLWREITKGLNLPSSITSAAFTLRTQYMKYLYPYECEKLKLSNPGELQSAIDGNRREGRRSSFGYDLSPSCPPTLIPPPAHSHLNGSLLNGKAHAPQTPPLSEYGPHRHYLESVLKVLTSGDSTPTTESGRLIPSPALIRPISLQRSLPERDHIAMEAASRAMQDATRRMEAASRASLEENQPPRKRMLLDEDNRLVTRTDTPSTHLRITSRNDGRSDIDNSLVVSMEINGIMYQGVLFAQVQRRI